MASNDSYPKAYMCHDKGLILPLIYEGNWPRELRAFFYLIALLWIFFGVAIIADIFMCSIEKITSRTKKIRIPTEKKDEYDEVEVKVWNDTVANLTLMALGSSAPEILLSIIEIVGKNFEAGELGPSTIVGSAAFNLLCITAVCIYSIPDGDSRSFRAVNVFYVTAGFSVFAYVWLAIILLAITKDVIDLWEAVVTFLFFIILIIIAYMVDKDFCRTNKKQSRTVELEFENNKLNAVIKPSDIETSLSESFNRMPSGKVDATFMKEFIKDLRKSHPNLKDEDIAKLAAAKVSSSQPKSRMYYRINATRNLGGNHQLNEPLSQDLNEILNQGKKSEHDETDMNHSLVDLSESGQKCVLEFTSSRSAILENAGRVRVTLRRYGFISEGLSCRIETIDGTAEANSDFVPIKETIFFEPREQYKQIDVTIIDDNEWEPDEIFFVKVALDPQDAHFRNTVLGKTSIHEITIINDDDPGTFEFSKPSLLFKESVGKAFIPVERNNGADGSVVVKWKTEDMTAVHTKDYEGGAGELIFEHGEVSKMIEIIIHDDQEAEKDEAFLVTLVELSSPGAQFGRLKRTVVTIINDDDFDGLVSRLVDMTNTNLDAVRMETTSWSEQFRNALNVNGGDVENASSMDYLLHFVTFGWKAIFALVPPTSIAGGWLTFCCALAMIALVTTFIGDIATIFGCLVNLEASVTAITFVALGTSLPDTFASKTAAVQEKTADNAIGNVTGSNSVNVFLGLGLPWLMASIYHTSRGDTFRVPSGSLGFSVIIFTMCAIITIMLLLFRHKSNIFEKSVLGGPKKPKIICTVFLVFLWILYILLSALQAYDKIKVSI